MKNVIEAVRFVSENKVVIYLEDRQFTVETTNCSAVALTVELLFPYFEMQKLKTEEQTVVVAA